MGNSEGSINRIMRNALSTKWTKTDDFSFLFYNRFRPLTVKNSGMSIGDVFDMCVINVDLPQLGSSAESVIIGGEYRIYNAKFEPFTFSVTFRDFGSLDLRTYFSAVWMDAQRGYFDDVKSHIKISTQNNVVFESRDCLITGVSQVQMDNSNSQVAEFTVEFSSPYYSDSQIKDFGSDEYRNSQVGSISTKLEGFGSISNVTNILGDLNSIISSVKSWLS